MRPTTAATRAAPARDGKAPPAPGTQRRTLVCVDFDDTLVVSQAHFERAERDLAALLAGELGVDPASVREAFARSDAAMHGLGRHRNRFLMTILATYGSLTGGEHVPLRLMAPLAEIAAHPYDVAPEGKPGVDDALRRLGAAFPGTVALVTAGDAVVQAGRIHRSGLARHFAQIHIVPDKTAGIFSELGRGHQRRVMIGNSARSDLLPALEAGYQVIHVQAPTWALDDGPLPPGVPSCATFAAAVDLLLA